MCHFKCVTSYESYETFKIPLALLKQLVSFSLKSIKIERERDRFVVCSHFCGFSFFWKWGHFLFRFCKYHIFAISFRNQGNCFSTLNGITSYRSRSCLCLFVVPCSSLTILTTKLAEIGELIGTEIPALMHLNYNTTDGSLLIVRRERYPDDEKK